MSRCVRAAAMLAAAFALLSVSAPAASAAPQALLHGSTPGGLNSQEAIIARAQGFDVTMVSDGQWAVMTSAQFGAYDLLIVGQICSVPAGLLSSVNQYAPVVMGTAGGRTRAGNRVAIGTDPIGHGFPASTSARGAVVRTGIAFAGKQPGTTGMYYNTCFGNTHLPILDKLSSGTGTWTANTAPPCGGSVSLIASNPAFNELTTASLQGWGCSVHVAYPTFRSDWSALAVATDTPTKPTCGVDPATNQSACGQAYVLIAGSGIVLVSGSISLAPATNTSPAGASHTVTATVKSGGAPKPGQAVAFSVTGTNAGAAGACVPVDCKSDQDGKVSFTYQGANGAGDDTIKGSFTDGAGSLQAATAQQTWTQVVADADQDGIPDAGDNCVDTANPDQSDVDGDGIGDACDPTDNRDKDGDGILDGADNCVNVPNGGQSDVDGDGIGDACDPDNDNDGVDDGADNCPSVANAGQADNDADGRGDPCDADDDNDTVVDEADNCQMVANADQADNDGDGRGDVCDADDDNDTVVDEADNCQMVANADQADNDADAQGDPCDIDDDNDSMFDVDDNCQFVSNLDQANNDGDSQGDACDRDDDNDTVEDGGDNCQFIANGGQADNDGDAQGDACDADDDNDTVVDATDNCQFVGNPGQADADGDGIGTACDPVELPRSGEQCKKDGWKLFYDGNLVFKNQGDCVSFVATNGRNQPAGRK